jgi:hypothetical protein
MRRRLLVGGLAVASLVPAGYLSNLLTQRECERKAARQIALGIRADGVAPSPVYVLPDSSAGSARALRAAGLTVRTCEGTRVPFDCFPWGDVAARHVAPYLISVKWGFVAEPLAGRGAEARYVCIFGVAILVSERGLWVT